MRKLLYSTKNQNTLQRHALVRGLAVCGCVYFADEQIMNTSQLTSNLALKHALVVYWGEENIVDISTPV